MQRNRLVAMIEAAFFAAIALVLDLLPAIQIAPGLSISFSMVPIFIIAFRWGFKISFISGFIWGLLQVVTGDIYFLTIIQFLIEYFIAFAFIGFAGLFYPVVQKAVQQGNKKSAALWVIVAVFVGSLARYFWHFIAGVIFWGEYAPEGMSPVMYSLVMNGGTMIAVSILCSIVLLLLLSASKRLFIRKGAPAAASEPPVQ
ncbi:proton-coupled thiamine transporter YuaJ [Mesobacillus campisalis]|uniref:Proton-coupled thiamine transporter YuaJ n=1 Tax=Mesobacillus campisalis TaxID=1408103 RepID=A0A0M2T1S5_9BACI|nr:energy-coupled thiamine transporter ThiT [Mesobacillus campisalis]KKK38770.1 proton-coupled thiamine transporter YuaJ [Mesobacillus campisalis]